jgi:hypothetical protein
MGLKQGGLKRGRADPAWWGRPPKLPKVADQQRQHKQPRLWM